MVGALAHSGRVIFAAGAVMVAVFFTFALSGPLPPKEMGIVLGVAVLLDAFLVRLVLLPVLLRLTGRAAWWAPRWLTRVLPTSASPTADRTPTVTDEGAPHHVPTRHLQDLRQDHLGRLRPPRRPGPGRRPRAERCPGHPKPEKTGKSSFSKIFGRNEDRWTKARQPGPPARSTRAAGRRPARGQNPMVISGAVMIELWTVQ